MGRSTGWISCGHCHCEFLATEAQYHDRFRHIKYCSDICRRAATGMKPQPQPYSGTCPTCGRIFGSRYIRIFCSIRCYIASPGFQQRIRDQARTALIASVIKTTGAPPKPCVEITCLHCGVKRIVKGSNPQKYCNSRCYRAYMAERFDRWIAAPQTIALPQGFDEFLSQTELPCLIAGCNWSGVQLGNHVNLAHGITAKEFKRAAGFNSTTGLVTPAVSEAISNRATHSVHLAAFIQSSPHTPPLTRGYFSLEGKEHAMKAKALMLATAELPNRTCEWCGTEYQPNTGGWSQKYCTVKCRKNFQKHNSAVLKFWMRCVQCKKDFQGNQNQHRRAERGEAVCCSNHCKGLYNQKQRKGEPK